MAVRRPLTEREKSLLVADGVLAGGIALLLLRRRTCALTTPAFVAIGGGASGPAPVVATSSDGAIWTPRPSPLDGGGGGEGYGLTYAPDLGLWVVVGTSDTLPSTTLQSSPDGVRWTPRPASTDGGADYGSSATAIAWSPQRRRFVAAALPTNGAFTLMTSPDAVTWTPAVTPFDGHGASPMAVCWAAGLGLFVAGFRQDTVSGHSILTSPDGITWTPRSSPFEDAFNFNAAVRDIVWAPGLGLLVAVGYNSASVVTTTVATSPDGITWTAQHSPLDGGSGFGTGVAWSPTRRRLVVTGGSQFPPFVLPTLIGSSDGVAWSALASPFAGFVATGVCADPQLGFVATGLHRATSTCIATSLDGIAWTPRASPWDATNGVSTVAAARNP